MPSVSKKQQRFFGIIRAIKKGVFKGKKTPEIQRAASSISDKDSKKMASTKHKGLPEKVKEELNTDDKPFVKKLVGKLRKGSKTHAKQADDLEKAMNEDYVKELEDGLCKMDYPAYDEVDKLMKKIAKDNNIDTTTLHMAFKTKHLMVPDDWAKKKMMEPVMIPKTPVNEISLPTNQVKKRPNPYGKRAVAKAFVSDMGETIGKIVRSKTTVHKEDNDLERVRATQASAETVKLNQKSENKFKTGKKVSRETLKRMNKPENQFEGMKYGMYKGDGKPKGAMAAYLERKKKEKKEVKEEQNPEGMKYSDKKKLERQEQLKKASEKAPVVTNKIVPTSKLRTEGSLHKWFKGSKSKDGKGGWVNVVTGGTCASDEPGEGTPKCVSSSKRASMTKKERKSAARRKKAADPGQQSKSGAAKPTYVSTDKPKKKVNEAKVDKLLPDHKRSGKRLERYGNPHGSLALGGGIQRDRRADHAERRGKKTKGLITASFMGILEDAKMQRQTDDNLDALRRKFGGMDQTSPANQFMKKRIEKEIKRRKEQKKKEIMTPTVQIKDNFMPEIQEDCWDGYEKKGMKTMFGKRYPNCVKKKKTRKEEYVMEKSCGDRDEYGDKKGGPTISAKEKKKNLSSNTKDEFSNNESYSANPAQQAAIAIAKKNRQQDLKVAEKKKLKEYKDVPQGQINYAAFNKPKPKSYEMDSIKRQYSGKDYKPEDKKNVIKYNQKVNSSFEPNEELVEGTPAWQRKAGKSESGGLNAKGVASYRAANPGSKLKTAVTTKPSKLKKGSKSAKRRKSFCSRMKGMKAKLTSAKTARDPDSRINKSLRKWNCSFEPDHGEVISEGKVAKMIKSLKRKTKVLEKGQKKTRDAGAIAAKIMKQKEHNKYVNFLPMDEEKKKCGEGEYYCNDDKKCKPIPKGYKIGYGGYLKPENENDESNGKKGGSNGNGNGHGGNGNGHGGNGNGGNGGGNGGGE